MYRTSTCGSQIRDCGLCRALLQAPCSSSLPLHQAWVHLQTLGWDAVRIFVFDDVTVNETVLVVLYIVYSLHNTIHYYCSVLYTVVLYGIWASPSLSKGSIYCTVIMFSTVPQVKSNDHNAQC